MVETTYQNPPIVLAVLEVRHLETPAITPGDVAEFRQALQAVTPLYKSDIVTQIDFQMAVTPDGSVVPSTSSRTETVHRTYSRARDLAITMGTTSITVETCNYRGWARFRDGARLALRARLASTDGIHRVGLRYIDEIRVPVSPRLDWRRWMAPGVVAPDAPEGWLLSQQQSIVQYAINEGRDTVAFRYGAVDGPSTFQSSPHLARRDPDPGPYFLIDVDASWQPRPGEPLPEAEVDGTLAIAERLHTAAKHVFESSITDTLRTEVLNHD